MTRRQFEALWRPVRAELPWADKLKISAHWYRHTLLDAIAHEFDINVAADWAGQTWRFGGVTAQYVRRTSFDDLCLVHERLVGPLQ